jgi:hypothetical protein
LIEKLFKREWESMRSDFGIAAGAKREGGSHKYRGIRKGNNRAREEEATTAGWGDENINSLSHAPE